MVFGILGLFGLLIGVLLFAFWIWMLVDCIQNPRLSGVEKILWFVVVFFLHFIGALIYMVAGRNK